MAAKLGTVMLIHDDNRPRLQWPLGVVVKVFPGRDGVNRTVELKTAKGNITSSIDRLRNLEIMNDGQETVNSGQPGNDPGFSHSDSLNKCIGPIKVSVCTPTSNIVDIWA